MIFFPHPFCDFHPSQLRIRPDSEREVDPHWELAYRLKLGINADLPWVTIHVMNAGYAQLSRCQ